MTWHPCAHMMACCCSKTCGFYSDSDVTTHGTWEYTMSLGFWHRQHRRNCSWPRTQNTGCIPCFQMTPWQSPFLKQIYNDYRWMIATQTEHICFCFFGITFHLIPSHMFFLKKYLPCLTGNSTNQSWIWHINIHNFSMVSNMFYPNKPMHRFLEGYPPVIKHGLLENPPNTDDFPMYRWLPTDPCLTTKG